MRSQRVHDSPRCKQNKIDIHSHLIYFSRLTNDIYIYIDVGGENSQGTTSSFADSDMIAFLHPGAGQYLTLGCSTTKNILEE